MSDKKIPLIIVLEDFKTKLATDINAGMSSGLPAYLVEDAIAGILADVRKLKVSELASAYKAQGEKDGE